MVTGLVTVNGNSRTADSENTKRRTRLNPTVRMETTPRHTQTKSSTPLQQPERDHTRTAGYYEPTTMILDHLAFSTKLCARAVIALGGLSQAFSDDLS